MFYEKLILSEKEDIFINEEIVGRLQKHQVQGIRTIYEQFKKKKPGIILNDPPLTGVTDEVVLFLKAVRPTLDKPILILSSSVRYWNRLYCHWPQGSNDGVICSSMKFSPGRNVYINSVLETPQLTQTAYGIVVADVEDFTWGLKTELDSIKADFKIIVTSKDLKLDLSTFSNIHSWLAPNEKKYVDKYLTKLNVLENNIEKAYLIECIFEEIVYRRNITGECYHEQNRHLALNVEKQLRKNKDASGTKIKKSRKCKPIIPDTLVQSNEISLNSLKNNNSVQGKSCTDVDTKNELIDELKLNIDETATDVEDDMSDSLDDVSYRRKRKNVLVYSDEDDDYTTSAAKTHCSPPIGTTSGETRARPDSGEEEEKANTNEIIALNGDSDECQLIVIDETKTATINKPDTGNDCFLKHSESITGGDTSKSENSVCNVLECSLMNSQFDAQMKTMEEETVKKFKGSLLDSLF